VVLVAALAAAVAVAAVDEAGLRKRLRQPVLLIRAVHMVPAAACAYPGV
jgi:hypothetical protein